VFAEKTIICAAILLLSIAFPFGSVCLLVVLSPWSIFAMDVLGWDPRLVWSVVLALRASVLPSSTITAGLPRMAICSALGFAVVSYLRLQVETAQIPAEELSGAVVGLWYFVSGICAGYAILKLTNTNEKAIRLAFAGALSLLIATGFGLFQAGASYAAGISATRISGSAGNPNYYAAYLALGATVMFTSWRLRLPAWRLYRVAALAATAACILTFSRMGTVACFLGMALAALVTGTRKAVNWKLIAVSIIALTAVVGLARSYLADVRNTFPSSGDSVDTELAMASQEEEDLTRLEAAQFAVQEFLEQPIFGAGFSTIADRNYVANGFYVTTHDTYAQVLAGTGLVGGALIALMILSVFRSIPRSVRRYALPACAEFAFCSFFADFLQSVEIFVMFAILIAILHHPEQPVNRSPQKYGAPERTSTRRPIHASYM
jgi:O-Antigen ligase